MVEAGEQREAVGKALVFFVKAAQVGSYRRWVEFTEESKEQRGILERALSRLRNRAMAGRAR